MTGRLDSFSPSLMRGENKMPSVRSTVSLTRGWLSSRIDNARLKLYPAVRARVAELVDAGDSKSPDFGRASSSLASGTS